MKWLRKIWDKAGWILTLPLILLIGILILLAIGLLGGLVSIFFTRVPFVIWGNLLGFSILGRFGFYLRKLSRESRLGFGWHLARRTDGFQIFLAAAGILTMAGAISSFTAPGLFTNLWKGLLTLIGFGIFLVILYAYVFVCGEFLAKGIILLRRWSLGGLFLLAVALVGLCLPGYLIYSRFENYYADGNWAGVILMIGAGLLIAAWLIFWFVVRTFDVNEWTLEENAAAE